MSSVGVGLSLHIELHDGSKLPVPLTVGGELLAGAWLTSGPSAHNHSVGVKWPSATTAAADRPRRAAQPRPKR